MRRFDAFVFDADTRQLGRDGSDVHLTPKAFDLLGLLLDAAPRVMPKAELHKRLWPKSFVSDATLVGLIKELRRALDDRDRDAPIIRTVPRVGYAFCKPTTTALPVTDGVWSWILVGGRRLPLREGENTIGRDPLSTVWIDVASVSRHHARIVCSGLRAVIEDVGSKNGTRVGAEALSAARELRDGDRIGFGRVDAVYCASESGLPTVTEGEWSQPSAR
jgi:DNA-binding winged helix-turn-helix (wHTH) protein